MSKKGMPNEIWITRVYDAPVEAVWDAWTDPAKAALWWGPRGFTLTTHAKDLRPGGTWHYTMHGPDGTDYSNLARYFEVEKYAKLVYDHGATETTPPLFRVTVTFHREPGGKTRMEMCSTVPTAEIAVELRRHIRTAAGESTWDRLGEYLDETLQNKETFVINRTFDAGLETVWRMWTDATHLAEWLPPTGFTMKFLKADIREGGSTLCRMSNGAGVSFHSRSSYLRLEKPSLVVYDQQFCDEHGKIAKHPLAPTWPETLRMTVRFTAEDTDRTRVEVKTEIQGQATAEEIAAFVTSRAGMTQGWTGSFDALEQHLNC